MAQLHMYAPQAILISQVEDLSFYYSTTAPANANVLILSVLLNIAGGLMIGTGICQIAATKKFKDLNCEIETTKKMKFKKFKVLSCGEFVCLEFFVVHYA